MICNYQNINDYCCNRYTYFYNDVVSSNGIVTVDDSELASVLRVDNVTGETKVLSPNSTDQIPTCEANDDNEGTNDWECYIISRYVCQNSVGDPPFGIFQEKQKEIIKETYNAALQDGIVVAINNKNVLLPASIQDQILYKSILSYAQALYDDDADSTMPPFTDVNGTIYNLGYTDLVAVFKTYFTKAIYYKNLQDTLLTQAEQASTMSDLEQCTWCGTKPLVGTLQPTKYSSQPLPAQVSVVDCSDIEIDTQPTEDNTPTPCDSDSDCWFCFGETGGEISVDDCTAAYGGIEPTCSVVINNTRTCYWIFSGPIDIVDSESRNNYCQNIFEQFYSIDGVCTNNVCALPNNYQYCS